MAMDHNRKNYTDALGGLIRLAVCREVLPRAAYDQTLDTGMATWQAGAQWRCPRRWMANALGVVVLLGVTVVFIVDRIAVPSAEVASLEQIIGTVETRVANDMDWNVLTHAGQFVNTGNWLRTGPGSRAGILLLNGASLHMDHSTELVFDSGSSIRLLAGKVYVDTGNGSFNTRASDDGVLSVATVVGTARDVGTQFEIQYINDVYRLRIRKGQVNLTRNSDEVNNVAGEEVIIDAEGQLTKGRVAPDDPAWNWAESVASAPDVDNQPVTVLLQWVARATGRSIQYAQPELETEAGRIILYGDIRHLLPMEALDVMLATTDLAYEILENGIILVRLKTGSIRSFTGD